MSETDLRRFHAREMPADDEHCIRLHLDDCDVCARRDAKLMERHETWLRELRSAGAPQSPAVRPEPSPPRADSIEGYEIGEELSRGGQGVVYRAVQRSTKRAVAIKVLRGGPLASRAARRRFEREIELVASLRHAGIVAVFDSGETADGQAFCVMDYIDGVPLNRYVFERSLPQREVLALFATVCDAVNFAHQKGVIHRDLKPSNILVERDGQARVLDFGLAKSVAEPGAPALTTTGLVAGTVPYMSPEQARGRTEQVDIRSDVYALGVVLYELLTGGFPYPVDGTTFDVLKHIAETTPVAPSRSYKSPTASASDEPQPTERRPAAPIDNELETLVLKALSKERDRRYQTAGDLARDVRHYLAGEPIEAKRDSGWYVLKKTLRRYRVAVGAAAAFVLLIAISSVALAVLYGQARAAEARARQRFEQVRELARSFIFEFDPKIRHIAGTSPARELLVRKGLAYLDSLAIEAGDDLQLQRELAAAYMTIGDVQGDPATSNLGDSSGALDSYQKSLRRLEQVSEAVPGDLPTLRTIVLNYNKIGDVHGARGDLSAAAEAYRSAVSISEDLRKSHPSDPVVRRGLADSYSRYATVLRSQGDPEAALEYHLLEMQIAEQIAAERPDDLWALREVGVGRTKLGQIAYGLGRFEAALEHYRKFLSIATKVQRAHPQHLVARRDLAAANEWVGIILADQGEHEAALPYAEKCVEIGVALLKEDEQNLSSRLGLARYSNKLGETQLALGRRDAAGESFQRFLDLLRPLAESRPGNGVIQRLHGVALSKMGELHAAAGRDTSLSRAQRSEHWRKAADWYQRCLGRFLTMRERGILNASDASVPEELEAELAACRTALEQLGASARTRMLSKPP